MKYDYDIVYVRAQRAGDKVHKRFYTDFSAAGDDGAGRRPDAAASRRHAKSCSSQGGDGLGHRSGRLVRRPVGLLLAPPQPAEGAASGTPPRQGADIYKIHVKTRKIVRLTNQEFTPEHRRGRLVAATSARREKGKIALRLRRVQHGAVPAARRPDRLHQQPRRLPARRRATRPIALQLFVMDDRTTSATTTPNVEKIGHLNIARALHPVVLTDGRDHVQLARIAGAAQRHPVGHLDASTPTARTGTRWSAPSIPAARPNGFHFQTQLSDGSIVVEEYYNQNNSGFGAYIKLPAAPPDGLRRRSARRTCDDPRNPPLALRPARQRQAASWYRMPFMPTGSVSLTPFAHGLRRPGRPVDPRRQELAARSASSRIPPARRTITC